MPPKRPLSPSPSASTAKEGVEIFTSPHPIKDRNSTFSAIYAPTGTFTSHTNLQIAIAQLQALIQFKSATHRIAAWRLPSLTQSTLSFDGKPGSTGGRGEGGNREGGASKGSAQVGPMETGFDDDGEKYGGKAVLKALTEMDAIGVVVVARWYGGVMLGPVRFEHIRNAARVAVEASGMVAVKGVENAEKSADSGVASKRVKIAGNGDGEGEDADAEKEWRIQDLRERDANIIVLRNLLAEKKGETVPSSSATTKADDGDAQASPNKAPAYEEMTVAELKRMDKVRDATVAWILKGIKKAEEEMEVREGWEKMEKAMVEEGLEGEMKGQGEKKATD